MDDEQNYQEIPDMADKNWFEIHILDALKRIEKKVDDLTQEHATTRRDLEAVKIRSGLWGILGGVLSQFGVNVGKWFHNL